MVGVYSMNEEEEHKAVQQFKLQLNGVFEPFNLYGLGLQIPFAKEIITELALQLHKRLNGIDHPIDFTHAIGKYNQRKKRKTL